MLKHYVDGRPIIFRASYRSYNDRWRGYAGTDDPHVSYGLCKPLQDRHSHKSEARAIACARRTSQAYPTLEDGVRQNND